MAKVIDLSGSQDGDLVIIGHSLVLPNTDEDSQPTPLNGALRFNPTSLAVEAFISGVWVSLGGSSGGGSGSPSSVTIAQVIGLSATLSNKANRIHSHVISDVTGLTGALASKTAVGHQHVITDVSGLQLALDNKEDVGHAHTFSEQERISGCFPGNPPALFKLTWIASASAAFPTNLVGSFFNLINNPAATYVITLTKNVTTTLGTISIAPTGTVTVAVASFGVISGDTITFTLPTRDTAINTLSFALVGTRAPETIS